MHNKRILLTGGTGFLGREIIKTYYDTNDITVYSRDEAKQYYLKKEYPRVNFVCGDVRNYDLLNRAAQGHDIGIFAASLKQIEACHDNYEEATQVILHGAYNSRRAAENNRFEAACFISSDKSRAATTIYGALKYAAGEAFISNSQRTDTRMSTVIYGNVLNSTGSVIPLIWDALKNERELVLYGQDMTRFFITAQEAVDLIEQSLTSNLSGVNVIPELRSMRIEDLFRIYHETFDLRYKLGIPRPNEKIHEIMASSEETSRMFHHGYLSCWILPQQQFVGLSDSTKFPHETYSSADCTISKSELEQMLKAEKWYKQ